MPTASEAVPQIAEPVPQIAARDPHTLARLPILILHVHSSCNCRCLMCDIWKTESRASLREATLQPHRESLRRLRVEHVVFTGGEPLLNVDLPALGRFFAEMGIRCTLLTTGLLLRKRAAAVAESCDEIIVSIDGPPAIHDGIRRVPGAFQLIGEGIAAVRALQPAMPVHGRCTVQRANAAHLVDTAAAARTLGLDSLSFLPADLTSTAFNRELLWPVARQSEIGLSQPEIEVLIEQVHQLADEREAGGSPYFIVEDRAKLLRLVDRFRAHLGQGEHHAPLCNAPWVSAVLELDGSVRPCFFHPPIGNVADGALDEVLNTDRAVGFRRSLDVAKNPTCQRCVCSLNYRQP